MQARRNYAHNTKLNDITAEELYASKNIDSRQELQRYVAITIEYKTMNARLTAVYTNDHTKIQTSLRQWTTQVFHMNGFVTLFARGGAGPWKVSKQNLVKLYNAF